MDLVEVLPRHCCPILVSDAGFHREWFDAVRRVGWDFIGRLRGRKKALRDGQLLTLEELHALAGKRPQCLGLCDLRSRRSNIPLPFRLVLSAKPKVKGRHRITSLGTKGRCTADHQRSAAAREPLLITSLSEQAKVIVATYLSLHVRIVGPRSGDARYCPLGPVLASPSPRGQRNARARSVELNRDRRLYTCTFRRAWCPRPCASPGAPRASTQSWCRNRGPAPRSAPACRPASRS